MIIKLVFKLGLSKILANKWPYWGLISNGLHHWNGHQSWIGGFNFFLNTNYILEHSLNLMLFNLEQIWWDKPSQKLIPSTPFISRYKIWLQIPTVLNHSSYVRYVTYRFKCTVYSKWGMTVQRVCTCLKWKTACTLKNNIECINRFFFLVYRLKWIKEGWNEMKGEIWFHEWKEKQIWINYEFRTTEKLKTRSSRTT